jgi:hypothetical protein
MLQLSHDEDRATRDEALYFGLSTVRDKQEPVIRRLIEIALASHNPNVYGRATWGIKGFGTDPARVEKVMADFINGPFADAHAAASVYFLHQDLLDREPPNASDFADAVAKYPDDMVSIAFDAAESLEPRSEEALARAFQEALPQGVVVAGLRTTQRETGPSGSILVVGASAREAVEQMIKGNSKLRLGPVNNVTPQMQLFLQEEAVIPRADTRDKGEN